MKSLIIGKGQVGSALYEVIKGHHEAYIRDLEDLELRDVEILHICYPQNDDFEGSTKAYIRQYRPKLTIIHSSILVGTTNKFGKGIVYSPVRGRHPKLASDLRIYTKFVFGRYGNDVDLAKKYFEDCGIKVVVGANPSAGELLKLLSNIHMGVEIAWRQEVERILESFSIHPEIYEQWERSYNEGYKESGDEHLMRPIMKSNPIGGHCIIPCIEILASQYPSVLFDFVIDSNNRAKEEFSTKNGQLSGVV